MVSKLNVLNVPMPLKELSLMLNKKNVYVLLQPMSKQHKMVEIVLVYLHTLELVMLTNKNVIPNAI